MAQNSNASAAPPAPVEPPASADPARVEQKVIDIMVERLAVERAEISRETRFYEKTDSLGVVDMVMDLEDEFEISIPDDQADKLRTVGDVIDYVLRHLPSTPPAEPVPAAAGEGDPGEGDPGAAGRGPGAP